LLVFGKVCIHHFAFVVSDDGGVSDLIRQREYPVKQEEYNNQTEEADAEAFEKTQYAFSGKVPAGRSDHTLFKPGHMYFETFVHQIVSVINCVAA